MNATPSAQPAFCFFSQFEAQLVREACRNFLDLEQKIPIWTTDPYYRPFSRPFPSWLDEDYVTDLLISATRKVFFSVLIPEPLTPEEIFCLYCAMDFGVNDCDLEGDALRLLNPVLIKLEKLCEQTASALPPYLTELRRDYLAGEVAFDF